MTQSLVLRPQVGMRQFVAVPYVVALGVCDALPTAGIAWPHDVVDAATRELLTHVEARGGYDDEGMFVRIGLALEEDVSEAVAERVAAWEAGPATAPLASVLSDYADKLVQLGKEVQVTYPNGKVYARGVFAGVDIWGRATVRLANGQELEFAPEKYRIG